MKIPVNYTSLEALYSSHNYPIQKGAINVFGFRNKILNTDKFDDTLGIILPGGEVIANSGTTDPGRSPLLKTSGVNANGIFMLSPGFYENCWHKGFHKGKYKALVQFGMGVFKGLRDKDHDGKHNMAGKIYYDVQGLNFHTTRWDKQVMRVGDFSEGCQVTEVAKEYDGIIDLIYASSQSLFSYALFQST